MQVFRSRQVFISIGIVAMIVMAGYNNCGPDLGGDTSPSSLGGTGPSPTPTFPPAGTKKYYLYSVSPQDGKISGYEMVRSTGMLKSIAGATQSTGSQPQGVAALPDGTY